MTVMMARRDSSAREDKMMSWEADISTYCNSSGRRGAGAPLPDSPSPTESRVVPHPRYTVDILKDTSRGSTSMKELIIIKLLPCLSQARLG